MKTIRTIIRDNYDPKCWKNPALHLAIAVFFACIVMLSTSSCTNCSRSGRMAENRELQRKHRNDSLARVLDSLKQHLGERSERARFTFHYTTTAVSGGREIYLSYYIKDELADEYIMGWGDAFPMNNLAQIYRVRDLWAFRADSICRLLEGGN